MPKQSTLQLQTKIILSFNSAYLAFSQRAVDIYNIKIDRLKREFYLKQKCPGMSFKVRENYTCLHSGL